MNGLISYEWFDILLEKVLQNSNHSNVLQYLTFTIIIVMMYYKVYLFLCFKKKLN